MFLVVNEPEEHGAFLQEFFGWPTIYQQFPLVLIAGQPKKSRN
jgi:hypothetical protein